MMTSLSAIAEKGEKEMSELVIKRVVYGLDCTPIERREYKASFTSSVGTRKEWAKFAKGEHLKTLVIVEQDKSIERQEL